MVRLRAAMHLSAEQLDRARRYLRRAVELSRQGMDGNFGGPFGAVIVRGQDVVGEGFNRVLRDKDPTAHAEMVAIRAACATLGTFTLRGCEIFASAQPCPMCLAAIYWSRLDRVWFANTVEQARLIDFDDAQFYEELAKPPDQRSLPQVHMELPEAWDVFEAWRSKPDKTPY